MMRRKLCWIGEGEWLCRRLIGTVKVRWVLQKNEWYNEIKRTSSRVKGVNCK